MIGNLVRHIKYGKQYCAILHRGTAQVQSIQMMLAIHRGEELEQKAPLELNDIEHISDHITNLQHTYLIVDNYQVLSKELERSLPSAPEGIVLAAFPNIDLTSFYYEISKKDKKTIVAICRKKYLQTLIKNYEQRQVYITAWSLGESALLSTNPTFSTETIEDLDDKKLSSIVNASINHNKSESSTNINDNNQLQLMAGLLCAAERPDLDIVSNGIQDQDTLHSNYLQHRFFKLGLPSAVAILFIIFSINFMYYNHYFSAVSSLNQLSDSNSIQKETLLLKDSLVNQKQKLFEDVIKSSASRSSLYIDQIIAIIPEAIILNKLAYQPLIRKIRDNKPVLIDSGLIKIDGVASKNAALSHWISAIEQLNFVSDVQIHSLQKQSRAHQFELKIKLGEL